MQKLSRREALAFAGALGAAVVSLPGPLGSSLIQALADGEYADAAAGDGLTGKVVYPNSAAYHDARLVWARQFSRYPLAIVYCRNVQDVLNAVTWARRHNVAIRARSGGHSFEGWSVEDGAVVVDVSRMKRVHVDIRRGVAVVQTGLQQIEIVDTLGSHDLAVPTGTEGDVGIAGTTLGGGLGFLGRRFGLACDNLIGVQMVVPHGTNGARVIHADERTNADLLWACRGGGGGNFGIATAFTFRTHRVSAASTYSLVWPWAQMMDAFAAWQEWGPRADERLGSVIQVVGRPENSVASTGLFLDTEQELRSLLQPLVRVGSPTLTMTQGRYAPIYKTGAGDVAHLKVKVSAGFAYRPFPAEGIRALHDLLATAPLHGCRTWCLSWGGAIARVPPRATAFPHRAARFFMNWSARWTRETDARAAHAWVERFRGVLQSYVSGGYVNLPDVSIGNWERAYYGPNFERLTRIKREYDPHNVFHYPQSIPPA